MVFIEFTADWNNTSCSIKVREGEDSKKLMDIKDCSLLDNYFVEQSINFLGSAEYKEKEIIVQYNHINDLALVVETCKKLAEKSTPDISIIAGITKENGTLYMPSFPKERIDKLGKPTSFSLRDKNARR